jgi:tetratricopeptide (TPR) repeat protein
MTLRTKTCCLLSSVALNLLCASALVAQSGANASSTYDHADHDAANYDKGIVEFRSGNYGSAAELFARVESVSPGKTEALLYESKCLVHLDNFTGAESVLRSYLASHANSSDALYMLGFVLNRQNHPAESLNVYTQAAAISPPTGDDLKIVGLDYVLLDDYVDAIHWLEKAVERDAKNADAWYYLGRTYYTKGRRDDARKAFMAVLNLDPHNVKAENNLGLILETDGRQDAAIEAYKNAIAWQEHNPHPSEQPYVNLGNLLMEQGQTKEAIEALEKAVALAPDNAYCRLTLGVSYHKIGRLEDAQEQLKRATQVDPENPVAHYQLGRVYKDMHAKDRAQAELDHAHAEVDRVQAEFDRAQGEFDRAQAELDRAQAEFDRTAEIKSRAAKNSSSTPNR